MTQGGNMRGAAACKLSVEAVQGALLFAAMLCGPQMALAQTTEDVGRAQVDDIVVTAQRYEQRLQDVPVSISAFSAADIEARSTQGLQEFSQYVPNLTFSNAGASGSSGNVIYLRGIGNNDSGIEFNPGVGVYLDGVYIGVMRGLDLDLVDVSRMEVLRGPQGTLFGRNATGGAINIVSRAPGEEFGGEANLTLGSYARTDVRLSADAPIVPGQLTSRFSIASRSRDGHGESRAFATGGKIAETGDANALSGRAMFQLTPTPALEFLLSVDTSRARERVPPYALIGVSTSPPAIVNINAANDPDWGPAFLTGDPFVNYATGPNRNDLDSFGVSLTTTWQLSGHWTLRSITSHREVQTRYEIDVDTGPYSLLHSWQETEQQQTSQEFLLNGDLFDGRMQAVAGLFFYTDEVFSDRPSRTGVANAPAPAWGTTTVQRGQTTSWAAYGQVTHAITSQLSLTGGLRYTEDETDASGAFFSVNGLRWSALTGRLGLEYRWSDDVMSYVSAARGYKSGGINSSANTLANFVPFNPEFLWTYEVGLKSDWFERRLRLNLAMFHSEYDDMQFRQRVADPVLGVRTFIGNAAAAEIDGVELEVTAVPTERVRLNLALGYLDARYIEVQAGLPMTRNSAFVETPEWTASAGVEYRHPVHAGGDLTARLDYSYRSAIEHDLANNPLLRQPEYGLLNARLTYEPSDGAWSVALFGTNLTDEEYFLNALDFRSNFGFASAQYGAPRELGISITRSF